MHVESNFSIRIHSQVDAKCFDSKRMEDHLTVISSFNRFKCKINVIYL